MSKILHVLLIEDSSAIADLLTGELEDSNIHVSRTASGKDGVRLIMNQLFNAAVLDLSLPDIPGLEVLKRLKFMGNVTPVIVISGDGDDESERSALELGAHAFLAKPFHASKLIEIIQLVALVEGVDKTGSLNAPS